jgi:hypothetical protein
MPVADDFNSEHTSLLQQHIHKFHAAQEPKMDQHNLTAFEDYM